MSRLYVEIRDQKDVNKTYLSPNVVHVSELEEVFYDTLVLMGFSPKYKVLVVTHPEDEDTEE